MVETTHPSLRPLTRAEFSQIGRLARQKFGVDLRPGKEGLVEARLGRKISEWGFHTFRQYYEHVIQDRTGRALNELINALTTHYTGFLREPAHFDFLRDTVFPRLKDRERIEIWSAACATGEEPYSIAFCALEEFGPLAAAKVRILATDISSSALATAERGVYPAGRVESLPAHWQPRYLLKGRRCWEGWVRVKPQVRRLIEFRQLNLVEPFPPLPRFAVIFCRNVMIYFERRAQQELIRKLAACLEPGGYLLTGHSESLIVSRHLLEYVQPAVYRKAVEAGRTARQR